MREQQRVEQDLAHLLLVADLLQRVVQDALLRLRRLLGLQLLLAERAGHRVAPAGDEELLAGLQEDARVAEEDGREVFTRQWKQKRE